MTYSVVLIVTGGQVKSVEMNSELIMCAVLAGWGTNGSFVEHAR